MAKDKPAKESMDGVIADKRFSRLHSDPRFMRLSRNKFKVQIDSRFQRMFSDKKFSESLAVYKRGKPKKKKDKNKLLEYDYHHYHQDQEEEEEQEDEEENVNKHKIKNNEDNPDEHIGEISSMFESGKKENNTVEGFLGKHHESEKDQELSESTSSSGKDVDISESETSTSPDDDEDDYQIETDYLEEEEGMRRSLLERTEKHSKVSLCVVAVAVTRKLQEKDLEMVQCKEWLFLNIHENSVVRKKGVKVLLFPLLNVLGTSCYNTFLM